MKFSNEIKKEQLWENNFQSQIKRNKQKLYRLRHQKKKKKMPRKTFISIQYKLDLLSSIAWEKKNETRIIIHFDSFIIDVYFYLVTMLLTNMINWTQTMYNCQFT